MSKTSASKQKSRLGRGLSSLLAVSELPVEIDAATAEPTAHEQPSANLAQKDGPDVPSAASSVIQIRVDSVTSNPHQPRRQIDELRVAELAASIKSTGLIQPIVVRKAQAGYQLIAGERRLRAARLAGLTTIPAIVRDVDNFGQAQMALVENIQREDLNPIDRAQGYRALADQLGLTQSELATRLGEDRSSVANYLRLLELCEPVREMVRDGKLSFGHAKVLAGVSDVLEQQRLAELTVRQELTVRNLERLLQSAGGDASVPRSVPGVSAHLLDLERTISRQLGMRVQVRANSRGRGRLTIHYGSLDQFDQLLAKLGVTTE